MKRVVAWGLLLASVLGLPLSGQQLELRFLDVGQADAILVREGRKTALIDAGSGAGVLGQLRRLGVDTLDLVVASHNHADHIGGMTAVLSSAVVRFYLDNGVPHTTATYQRTIQAVRSSGAQYLSATCRTITLGEAELHILPPAPGQDQNNSSVGILVEYGQFRALLTGDSELRELEYWLSTDVIPKVNVIKVAHHGSRNGTSPAWIAATSPQAAVISVGQNGYGHPSSQVLADWQKAGARVYRTDRDGGVVILANNDGSFVITTDRSDPSGVVQVRPFVQDTTRGAVVTPTQATPGSCCRVCARGQACGNSCISRAYQCRQPPGCACDAQTKP